MAIRSHQPHRDTNRLLESSLWEAEWRGHQAGQGGLCLLGHETALGLLEGGVAYQKDHGRITPPFCSNPSFTSLWANPLTSPSLRYLTWEIWVMRRKVNVYLPGSQGIWEAKFLNTWKIPRMAQGPGGEGRSGTLSLSGESVHLHSYKRKKSPWGQGEAVNPHSPSPLDVILGFQKKAWAPTRRRATFKALVFPLGHEATSLFALQ